MAYIKCENLCVNYGDTKVIEDLSFEVNPKDYLFVVGENGSGKTTLMKVLLGLLQPTSGKITFGEGLTQNEIGYLPQRIIEQQDFPATVEEVVLSGNLNQLKSRFFYRKEEKEKTLEMMKEFELDSMAKQPFQTLSGGQRQRVLLARALLASKKLLLLDEPVTGLDPTSTEELYALLQKLHKNGLAIMMITHDVEELDTYATHVLDFGKDIRFMKIDDYRKEHQG